MNNREPNCETIQAKSLKPGSVLEEHRAISFGLCQPRLPSLPAVGAVCVEVKRKRSEQFWAVRSI